MVSFLTPNSSINRFVMFSIIYKKVGGNIRPPYLHGVPSSTVLLRFKSSMAFNPLHKSNYSRSTVKLPGHIEARVGFEPTSTAKFVSGVRSDNRNNAESLGNNLNLNGLKASANSATRAYLSPR